MNEMANTLARRAERAERYAGEAHSDDERAAWQQAAMRWRELEKRARRQTHDAPAERRRDVA
jgi:hypothetical protein